MKRFFLLLFLVVCALCKSGAQGENNVWCFGYNVGIDLNQSPPQPFLDSMHSFEGCASICDSSGKLLFYSSGFKIWLPDHTPMPGSDGLLGNTPEGSCTQGVTIIRSLQNPRQYYHFVLDAAEVLWSNQNIYLRYSVIDMSLNNGRGAVLPGLKNIVIDSFLMEKMAVTIGYGYGSDCPFYWLVTRHYDTAVYAAYKIDHNGIHSPIFSAALDTFSLCSGSEMKISPDGKKIATPIAGNTEVGSFNNITGKVSNLVIMDSCGGYGISFSPNGTMLYTVSSRVMRYDLTLLPDVNNMINNAYVVSPFNTALLYTSSRIGPDDKIYLNSGGNFLSRINNPDAYNVPSDLEIYAIDFRSLNTPYGALGIGSPTVVVPFCTPPANGVNEHNVSDAAVISCYPNPAQDLLTIHAEGIPDNSNVIITDLAGGVVSKGLIKGPDTIIDISHLSNGAYIVKVVHRDSHIMLVTKILKQG